MDKFKNSNFAPALVVKLILVLVFLLTAAFVSGVLIGKNGRRNVDRTSSDEEGINEKLSNCIFNSDELRGKYLKLRDAAREKGLVDENDAVHNDVVCKPVENVQTFHETSLQEKPGSAEPESVEPESAEQKDAEPKPVEQKPAEKPENAEPKPVEPVQTDPVQTFHETSPQEPAKLVEKPKQDKTKTIDEILSEKKAEPKKGVDAKCHFSIQLAFLDSIDQVNASKKEFKSLKLRVLDGESKGKKWYKVRTGCFDSREAAESELSKVKKIKKDAFIVSE